MLELGEYRESVDIDLLCADRVGYRAIRSEVTQNSFGRLFKGEYRLMRDIRADRYGIRTWLEVDNAPVKFEIVSEGRISLTGESVQPYPVQLLDRFSCIVEKFLANTDRGRDSASLSRDLIDLAFMAHGWPEIDLNTALTCAIDVYGDSVIKNLEYALRTFNAEGHRNRCLNRLDINDTERLNKGLARLKDLIV